MTITIRTKSDDYDGRFQRLAISTKMSGYDGDLAVRTVWSGGPPFGDPCPRDRK